MRIFVDADACPKPVREILCNVAIRSKVELILVSNQILAIPIASNIRFYQVAHGFDEADKEIVRLIEEGDLVITADIPLADDSISKGARVLTPRGKLLTQENIKQQLAVRDLMSHLRDNFEISGGPATYDLKDKANFANELNKIIK